MKPVAQKSASEKRTGEKNSLRVGLIFLMTSLLRAGIDMRMGDNVASKMPDRAYVRLQLATWCTGLVCSSVALGLLRFRKEGDSPLLEVISCLALGIVPHAMMFRNELRELGPMAPSRWYAYCATLLSRALVPLHVLAYIYGGYFWVEEPWGASWVYLSLLANVFALLVPWGRSSRHLPILGGRFHPAAVAAYGLTEIGIYIWWTSGG